MSSSLILYHERALLRSQNSKTSAYSLLSLADFFHSQISQPLFLSPQLYRSHPFLRMSDLTAEDLIEQKKERGPFQNYSLQPALKILSLFLKLDSVFISPFYLGKQ